MRRRFAGAGLMALATLLLSGADARAQTIGVGAGVVKTQDTDNTLYLVGNLRLGSGPLVLEPEVGYWKKTVTLLGVDVSAKDVTYGANLLIVVPASSVEVFFGAGLGAHQISGSFSTVGLTTSASETKLGVHLLGGLDFKLSKQASIFGAARYDIVHTSSTPPPPADNLHETKFYAGLRFHL